MSHFKLSWEIKELKLKEVFTISRSSRSSVKNVFIILTKDDISGYGEASPNTRYNETPEKVITDLEKIPADFFEGIHEAEELPSKIDKAGLLQSTKAAIEMAWLDWWGKSQKQPLWKLWGADSQTACVTSFTIGIDTPQKMQEKIKKAGRYPVYKIKLGTDHDRKLIKAIREVTDKRIRVDANEGWLTLDQAKREIEFLAKQNVELIEQPMPSAMLEEMKELKKWSPVPLCADESFIGNENLEELSEAFDILNIKLMKIGSLIKARKVIDKAHKLGMEIMIGCMIESSLANAAGGLLALWAKYCDLDGHLLIGNDPFEGLALNEKSEIVLSAQPGLGITLS